MKIYLNKKEEEIMRILWKLKKAFVKEIIESIPNDKKPPYNTISSIVRKLEDRGLVGHEAFGKTHRYYPILQENEYRKQAFRQMFTQYFGGSVEQVVSFFVHEDEVSVDELTEVLEKIKKNNNSK